MAGEQALIEFARLVGRLKALPRQGWVDRGISEPESVADHTYRAVMLAWVLGHAAGLDTDRLVKLMLVHDLAEAKVGDTTPYGPLLGDISEDAVRRWRELLPPEQLHAAKLEKREREAEALGEMIAELPETLAREIRQLARDYAERDSVEARFAAQIDKIEALLQAVEYDEAGLPSDVENFRATVRDEVVHATLIAFVDALCAADQHRGGENEAPDSSRDGNLLEK
jgi:putative hydrolase of HD superfamily